MNSRLVDRIVSTVLYEGYILYPYRASSVKNQQRFNFGTLYPEGYCRGQRGADASAMRTECLVRGGPRTALDVKVRFLHSMARTVEKLTTPAKSDGDCRSEFQVVDEVEIDGQLIQSWREAVERDVSTPTLTLDEVWAGLRRVSFEFPAMHQAEEVTDASGSIRALIVRNQEFLEGTIDVSAVQLERQLFKLTVAITNRTEILGEVFDEHERALGQSLLSTHTILGVHDGDFISLLEPPEEFRDAAALCRNEGTWPVLVGDQGEHDCMLSSPIILYDYPEIAPESAGDLFDGTEIDEILTLRIMTLADSEKRQMRGIDERARRILERTETLPIEQLMKMHGAVRGLRRVEGKKESENASSSMSFQLPSTLSWNFPPLEMEFI